MKRRYPGFTLIELMVALAIFGLLLMLAGPQYANLMGNSQIRNAAEAMLNGVQQAQSRAIHSNAVAPVVGVVPPQTTTVWLQVDMGTGWQVHETIETADNVVQVYSKAEGAPKAKVAPTPGDATQITFDGFGRVVANADASATLTCLKVTNPDVPSASMHPLNVAISSTGIGVGTKICDPDPNNLLQPGDPLLCPAGCR